MAQPCRVEYEAQTTLDARKMVGGEVSRPVAHAALRQGLLAHEMGQVGYVDFHRARCGTQAVAGARLVALIAVLLDESRQALGVASGLTQVGDFALDDDALARGQRQSAGETVHFTEAALNALVGLENALDGLAHAIVAANSSPARGEVARSAGGGGVLQPTHLELGQGLEMLDEALGVVVEDDAGVEQIMRVENLLQLAHGGKGLLAPLILDKWRHVAARAVLGFERAVILLYHETCHVAHHRGIALHLALVAEELVDDEVVIALKSVAIDAGVLIAMVSDEALQFDGGLGQVFNGKGNVLNQTRGAHGSCTAHTGEDARADGPILAKDGRIGGEFDRDIGLEPRQASSDGVDALLQVFRRHGLGLGKDGGEVVIIARLDTLNLACIDILLVLQIDWIVDRGEREVVEHLGTLDHQVFLTHGDIVIAGV